MCEMYYDDDDDVLTFEDGLSEANKGSKFECRSVIDFRHNRTQ